MQKTLRINRILSLAGLTSRRKADEWIKKGRITVNGRPVTELGARALWGKDRIQLDGKDIPSARQGLYLLLNKPFGYISSLMDPQGRPLVTDLLKDIPERVYPVGRLDFDTLGLLLLTNDGDLTYRLTHPSYEVPRTYKVTVEGRITDKAIKDLRAGVRLEDGPSGRSKATIISKNNMKSIVRLTITQGRQRQVRRMLQAVNYKVIHLMRTSFGPLSLGDLKVGEYRYLETVEVETLKKMVGLIPM